MNLNYCAEPIVLEALQGDSARALAIHFLSGETPWEIPADAQIFIQFQCQDGTGGTYDALPDTADAYSVDGDTLTVGIAPAVCAAAGCSKLQITIISEGAQLTTFPVEVRVAEQVNSDVASGEYTNLHRWLNSSATREMIVADVLAALPDGDEVAY